MALMNDAPATLWVATCDTGSFDFTTWGRTQGEARMNLICGLVKHARQYRLGAPATWAAEMADDAAWIFEVPNGACLRDGSVL